MRAYHIISFFIIIVFCSNCSEDKHIYEEFVAPTFDVISYNTISDDECIIEIDINSGVGAELQFIQIELRDITDEANETIKKTFSLNENKEQTVKAQIKVPHKKHDYRTYVTLKSAKNTYDSSPFFLRFSDEFGQDGIKYIYFSPSGLEANYVDDVEKVALNLKKGQRFYFMIEYSKLVLGENSIQVKLNGKYEVEVDEYYYGTSYDGEIGIHCTLPNEIDVDTYDVHVYINGLEYKLDYRIKVLKGSSEVLNIDSPPNINGYLGGVVNHFIINDDVYYIYNGGGYWHVLCLNMETLRWERKKNIVFDELYRGSQIRKERINLGTKNYCLVEMYNTDPFDNIARYESISLWGYDNITDSWSQISTYPGLGEKDFTTFGVDDNIYVGGGLRSIRNEEGVQLGDEGVIDFWVYNIKSKGWKKINDLPYDTYPYYDYISSTTTHDNNAFIFTTTRQLWEYNTLQKKWTELAPLRKGPYSRINSKLLSYNEKLYLAGGYTYTLYGISVLSDVWEYDLETSRWDIIDMQEYAFSSTEVPTFIYQNMLYLGYGNFAYSDKDLFYKVKINR